MKGKFKIVVYVAMLVLLLAACGSEESKPSDSDSTAKDVEVNKEGFPIVDEKIELTMMGPNVGNSEWEDLAYFKVMEKKTNIKFNFNTPPSESFKEKRNLAIASEDLPDIFYAGEFEPHEEVKYGEEGVFIPLEDLIDEYAPNIQKMLDENPDIRNSITTNDGHIYALPRVETMPLWYSGPLFFNQDWIDSLGIEELPKSTDELYALLKRFKDEDPNGNGEADEIPLTAVKMDGLRPWLLAAFGLYEQGVQEVDGKVTYGAIEPEYKAYLEYMHKLYEDGLLDNEAFSQTGDQQASKIESNKVGLASVWGPIYPNPNNEAIHPMLPALTSPESPEKIAPIRSGISRGTFAITSKNQYPEATMRWIDYSYGEEGSTLLSIGPEGEFWEWENKEEGLKKQLTDDEDALKNLIVDYGISAPKLAVEDLKKGYITEATEFQQNSETKEKILPYGKVPYPDVYLTSEEQKVASRILADLETYVEQMEAKFITGVEPLSNWDKYVDTINSMKVDQLIENYQSAYDRWSES